MKTKDQILLEKVYSKMVLKEAIDLSSLPNDLKEFFQNKPSLWKSNINLGNIRGDIDLSFLEECEGYINAGNAISLDLRSLRECESSIEAHNATSIDLRNLQTCGGYINAGNAISLDLRSLQRFRSVIYANQAKSVDLRSLQTCGGYIEAYKAETIIIPKEFRRFLLLSKQSTCKIYTKEEYEKEEYEKEEYEKEELYKTGFEPKKMLDPELAKQVEGLFFNRNEN